MNRDSIIKEALAAQLKTGEILQRLGTARDNIRRIDIDIALEQIRRLYDLLLELRDDKQMKYADSFESDTEVAEKSAEDIPTTSQEVNTSNVVNEEPISVSQDNVIATGLEGGLDEDDAGNVEKEMEEQIPAVNDTDRVEADSGKIHEQVREEEEETVTEKELPTAEMELSPDVAQFRKGKKTSSKETQQELTMDLFGETVADRLKPEAGKTIADTITETVRDESVADVINKEPVSDLKSAIGINEKFFFIRELFDGNMEDYNKAVDLLNNAATKDEALGYFEEMRLRFNWSDDNEAAIQLKELLNRKFS